MRPLSNLGRESELPLPRPRSGAGETAADARQPITHRLPGGETLHFRPPHRHELHDALRLILGGSGRGADDAHILEFLQFALYRGIDTDETWVAVAERPRRPGRIVWAVLPVVSPGRTMLLLTPGAPPRGEAGPAAGMLVEQVCSRHAARGVHLAQVLLDPADDAARETFSAHGFRRMAELLYLQSAVRAAKPAPAPPPGLDVVTYSPATHALFSRTIAETYRQSLDCPALNGLRDMEDVVAGHKASGEFVPQLWFLCREGTATSADAAPEPRGVLLLSPMVQGDAVELVYLGLTPAARGRGLGEWLMRHALASVAAAGRRRLSLAVDSLNAPALRLYYRFGMRRVTSKLAMIRDLRAGFRVQGSGFSVQNPEFTERSNRSQGDSVREGAE